MGSPAERILIVCKGHRNIAGAQLYLQQISALFEGDRFELHFALNRGDGTRVFDEIGRRCKVSLWDYDWRHLGASASFGQGTKLFRTIRPQVVVFNSAEDAVLPSVLAARFCGVPHRIMVVHWAQDADSLPLFRKRVGIPFPVPSPYAWRTRLVRGGAYRNLTGLLFVNQGTRKAYSRLYRSPQSRCRTIYNGVDVNRIAGLRCQRERVRAELGIRGGDCLIMASGNLVPVKGHEFLVAAVARLAECHRGVRCVIAGQGELAGALRGQIEAQGLHEAVRLLGYRDDVESLLQAADIFCMPSLNEALGYSLLEAMAAGLPVVASAVGGIPEVVTDGREGRLVPAGDSEALAGALEQFVSNDRLRERMGGEAQRTARQRFSLERMLIETRAFLSGDLGGRAA